MNEKITRPNGISIRALASMTMFCAGLCLVPSGIALHSTSHHGAIKWSHLFMSIHNVAAFLFLIAAIGHVILNYRLLIKYMRKKVGESTLFKRELLMALIVVSGLVMIAAVHVLFMS
ncbi:MAG: hypothetical protein KJ737_18000 [Proteobacteria bacterium]|nr:hypothetical protein [Pseudomonadota bacterium]